MLKGLKQFIRSFVGPLIEDPKALQAYWEYDRQLRIRRLKVGSLMVLLFEPLGYDVDEALYPGDFGFFMKLRLACGFLAGVILLLAFTPIAKKFHRGLGILLPLLPNFATCWMVYVTEGALSPYYAGINLVLMAVALIMPWTALETTIVAAISTLFYLAACYFHGPVPGSSGIMLNNLDFLVYTEIIIIIGAYLTYHWREREFTLRYELDQNRQILERTNQKLVDLDQMKSRFFANISHELRTPLTLLISPLESIQAQKGHLFDEEMRDTFRTMEANALRLLKLINDLLDLVKLESGQMKVKKEPVELEGFIRGILQSVQAVARDKRVELQSSVEGGVGVVMVDRDKLEKILLNLVFNAIKFTQAGGKAEVRAGLEEGALVIQVKDTGMGIPEENLPFIFDRFWQGDSSAQRKYQGTGIGLALVKELAEAQGGRVSARSHLEKGTVMTVQLPYERAEAGQAAPAGEAVPGGGSGPEEWLTRLYRRAELFPALTPVSETLRREDFSRSRKPKVLVADDEPDMLRFLHSQLARRYEVLEAVDGNQAVEKARQFLPDLIILDMMMPEKDGIEACTEIKADLATQNIPVILLTARADEDTKMASLGAGASDFLTKPFSTTELHVRAKNLLDSYRYQRDLSRQKVELESAMEQLKDTESQLVQNEKMASLGRLSAGLIHEINNPLNYVASALHILRTRKDRVPEAEREQYNEVVSDIEEGIRRVQRIVSDLRTFTHPRSGGVDLVQLDEAVTTALRFLAHEMKDLVKAEIVIAPGQTVLADRNKLLQVLINLVQNATDALREKKFEEGGPALSIVSVEEKGRVTLRVRDNGTGIKREDLGKIFDPFFTTKDVGKGMGLGLSVCYRLIHEMDGAVSVTSERGKFTEFVLELPARDQ